MKEKPRNYRTSGSTLCALGAPGALYGMMRYKGKVQRPSHRRHPPHPFINFSDILLGLKPCPLRPWLEVKPFPTHLINFYSSRKSCNNYYTYDGVSAH